MPEEIKDKDKDKDPIEQVKVNRSYERDNNTLKVVDTPEEVIPTVKSYNINDIKNQITKIDRAIKEWEDKKAPLQLIIDKYEELNPVEIDNPSDTNGEYMQFRK